MTRIDKFGILHAKARHTEAKRFGPSNDHLRPSFLANSPQGAVFRTTKLTGNGARECNLPRSTCYCQPDCRPLSAEGKEYSPVLVFLAGGKVDAALAKIPRT